MRKRIWIPWTHRIGISRGMNGRYVYMSGPETHINYIWEGRLANIHGTTILIRRLLWNNIKEWFLYRFHEGAIYIWLMVTVCILVLIGSLVALAHHEGML